ncbi:acetyltransferase, ribosomal protein N-acetylase [Azospira oryzae PS]|uniref:Acetyltransferase, ribosomal protein N-acetylase n=1 Tax=Azospira oryzae (strain ATCC BAA-33 / DSM 13638 / PS) TaxID=640081 RepID=G8QLH1_AZOOP|nr:GNAT family N-acetyltransferase [Azospira oryzae]AEV24500.1 acetyltransferase, ribosomal protein N-acetylase [Azospira oryzae PS]TLS17841.1 MAG: GNAT family N-acetyltransferase [Betaproteobacteria bacterium]
MIYRLGDAYYVRPLREADLDGPYLSWFEDQEVCRYNSHGKYPRNREYFRAFYDSLNGADKVVWAICHDQDGHIGNISLQGISSINQHAEFAVLLGDRRHWQRGVSRMAGQCLIEHGFNKLNLVRIFCGTAATNLGMQRLALSLGFREEGRRKAHLYLDGQWVDVIDFGLLRPDVAVQVSI